MDSQIKTWQDWLNEGRVGEALKTYLEQGSRDDDTIEALTALSEITKDLRAKRWSKAIGRANANDSADILDWQTLSKQLEHLRESSRLLDKRKSEEALALIEQITSPVLQAESLTQQGTAFIFDNDTEKAREAFARALELDPKHYRALTNLGNLNLEAGNVDAAIASYEAALKINDSFSNAHHNLGVAYRKKGNIQKSVGALRRAQRNLNKHEAEEARSAMSQATNKNLGKYARWVFYGIGIAIVYFILRSRGII